MICHYCNFHQAHGRDHIVPVSKGGTNEGSNIVMACLMCNMIKGAKDYEWFYPLFQRFLDVYRAEYQDVNPTSYKEIRKWQRKFDRWASKHHALQS